MTFSLAARDPATGAFGLAVSSSSPAVAARCLHLRPAVGAAASQNVTNPALGPRLLDLIGAGSSAEEAMAQAVAEATQKNSAKSIIGGGDSVKALNKAKLGDKVTFMSTGGGESLEFLEGTELPGVAALSDK